MKDRRIDITVKVYDHERQKMIIKPLKEIMKEMIAAQMPITFHIEALKAQAMIVRTSLVRKLRAWGGMGCPNHPEADVCTEGDCGDWISKETLEKQWGEDFATNWERLDQAVTQTQDQIITIGNKPIDARCHRTCGGATENSEKVEGNKILYLRKVLCDYCKNSPHWDHSIELSLEEIEKRLNIGMSHSSPCEGADIDGMMEEVERDEEGRVEKIKIGGTIFKGTEVMEKLGLDSTRFGWKPIVFKFETRGRGDGLGLCQCGANTMATEGKSAQEILNYYFTGVQIKKFEKPSINQPLSGKIIVIDPGHGGNNAEDTEGPTGLREKDVNLEIGAMLAQILREAGAEVYETRTEDVYVSLSKRVKLANTVRPNFFLSIHQNSFANASIAGSEIYHYRGDRDGEVLGGLILKELAKELKTTEKGVKVADFYLLREVRSTALQIEVAFISNPDEEAKLRDPDFLKRAAKAIAAGVIEYYSYA